jgi:hypothetical protein
LLENSGVSLAASNSACAVRCAQLRPSIRFLERGFLRNSPRETAPPRKGGRGSALLTNLLARGKKGNEKAVSPAKFPQRHLLKCAGNVTPISKATAAELLADIRRKMMLAKAFLLCMARSTLQLFFSHFRIGVRGTLPSAAPMNIFSGARLPSQRNAKPLGAERRMGMWRAEEPFDDSLIMPSRKDRREEAKKKTREVAIWKKAPPAPQ